MKFFSGRFLSSCLFVPLIACARDDDDRQKPASEPSTIGPAGVFVLDTATGKPAVGSLPVDFVRSPDHDGPDGAGRYLLAINSG